MTWIKDLLEATKDAESPKSFIYWSGMAAISAVVKKQVWIDKHLYKLYPNIYVMLIGKSGIRKGFPINVAKDLVQAVDNTRIIAGRNSIQAVVQELSHSYTKDDGKGPVTDANAFLVSQELATFLVEDPAAINILTDLYDTHSNKLWQNTLKSGKEILKEVCLTMLSASNMALFKEAIPNHAHAGGFIARTLIISETRRSQKNHLLDKSDIPFDVNKLAVYLKEIAAKAKGEFHLSPEAKKVYTDWYMNFEPEEKEDDTGTSDRIHDQILKVAMLISLSKKIDMVIEESDMTDAMTSCLAFTSNSKRIAAGSGKSPLAAANIQVLDFLANSEDYSASRTKLLQRHYGDFDAFDLDKVVQTLTQAGAITVTATKLGPVYRMEPEYVKRYLEYKEAKQKKVS